ncbi:MAG: hypothetical protein JWP58_2772 [Hymenobacter sp.]|nr:hypothetical protein [Hymenobacter sp.]
MTTQNLAYGYGQEASAAAKILFAEDAATLKLFRLSGTAVPVLEHHEVTLAPDATAFLTFETPLLPTSRLHLRLGVPKPNQQATVGRMVAGSAGPTQTVTLNTDQSEMDVLAPDLGPAGQVFRIQNGSDHTLRIEIGLLK